MDSLFLLQFTCFLFVSINAIILGISTITDQVDELPIRKVAIG